MKITRITLIILGCCCFLSACHLKTDGLEGSQRTNVLLITADDLNYNSVGVYGCQIPDLTPHIDKLAAEGVRFTHAYVNVAVCQPSRQSILTGRYPHRNGAPGFDPISPDVPTLQEQLREAGYLNGIIGKEKHLMPAEKFCWDFCIREGDVASGMGIGRDPERYYQFSKEFMDRSKTEGKPFFLMANSHDPHRPFAGSEQEQRSWGADPPLFTKQIFPEEAVVPGFLFDLPAVRKEVAEYFTSVYRCDQTVGAVLKALDDSGLADQTLVMFLSDNGMSFPFAKANCYLNSNKTPWIVRWPERLHPGSVDSIHFISGIDYMPTILHALHLSNVADLDGFSFLPVLEGQKQHQRDHVFTQFHTIHARIDYPMRSVQDRRFGYIVNFWSDGEMEIQGDGASGLTYKALKEASDTEASIARRTHLYRFRVPEEFYDFSTDPDGLNNLIDQPEYQEDVLRMKKMLYQDMKKSSDPFTQIFSDQFLN